MNSRARIPALEQRVLELEAKLRDTEATFAELSDENMRLLQTLDFVEALIERSRGRKVEPIHFGEVRAIGTVKA